DYGRASSVSLSEGDLVVKGAPQDAEKHRQYLAALTNQRDETKSEYEKEKLNQRVARLASEIVEIEVGGVSEQDGKLLNSLATDAIHAARMGVQYGVVPAGGATYARGAAAIATHDELTGDVAAGANALVEGLIQPLRCLSNANDS